ncbi:hypothetical protein BBJ28_00023752 [Nothophytophthora sp. Chile5]|nr:hypothetical protein BBJ28_00023752 [Nothophytophthora sp. Chile5]
MDDANVEAAAAAVASGNDSAPSSGTGSPSASESASPTPSASPSPIAASGASGASAEASGANSDTPGRRVPRSNYSVRKKRELIALAQVAGVREVCRMEGIPRRTLRHWLDDAEKINSFAGPDSRKSIGRSGRREILPFARELSAFLQDARRAGREMTSAHMIEFIRERHSQWLDGYLAGKKSAESGHAALTRLCQRFVERHGFTHPKTTTEDDVEDGGACLFGLDIGTTAVKCVVVSATSGQTVAMASVALSDITVPSSQATGEDANKTRQGVQNVEQVLLAVQRAVLMLPETSRRQITSVGICGQMHGIVWWCCRAVRAAAGRLLSSSGSGEEEDDIHEPTWSELVTWQDQRCTPAFLSQCRHQIARSKVLASTDAVASSPIAAGYGLATFAHTLEHAPRTLVGMDACGTIQDFVAFVLCGHTQPSDTCMDTTDAFSWGCFDLQTQSWDARALRALQIPSSMLPAVKKPGSMIGRCARGSTSFGLPEDKPVYLPMGDHPCSVLAALAQRQAQPQSDTNLTCASLTMCMNSWPWTVVNIGTSAQMAMVLAGDVVAKLMPTTQHHPGATEEGSASQGSESFEVRPFLFEDRFLGVAASLSGGNTFAWLVQQWQEWAEEMALMPAEDEDSEEQAAQREAAVYARLIALGLQQQDTELTFVPTLNGERANPSATGSILNLRMDNWSMGDISAALCRGLVENLFAMIPKELQSLVPAQTYVCISLSQMHGASINAHCRLVFLSCSMIGTGNALVRNELLQRFLTKRLAQPTQLQIQTAADAAVGAALTPSLLY